MSININNINKPYYLLLCENNTFHDIYNILIRIISCLTVVMHKITKSKKLLFLFDFLKSTLTKNKNVNYFKCYHISLFLDNLEQSKHQ